MILFIDTGKMNIIWEKIAKNLENKGYRTGVLYFGKKKYNRALKLGINAYFIDLNQEITSEQRKDCEDLIKAMEYQLEEFTLSSCIEIDRYLKSNKKAYNILYNFAIKFQKIVKKNNVKLCLGEISYAIELLAYNICKFNHVIYANPLNIYLFPEPRVTFFDTKNSDVFINLIANKKQGLTDQDIKRLIDSRNNTEINSTKEAKEIRKGFSIRHIKSLYHYYLEIGSSDYRYTLWNKRLRITKELKRFIIACFSKYFFSTQIPQQYILMLLHVQPEATPDVVAYRFSNQLEIARQIAVSIPNDYKLVIKEHPNGVGWRSFGQLKRFKMLPNTLLINPYINSSRLIERSSLVITICGTAAYEAALKGKPSIIFSDIYFSGISSIHKISNFNRLWEFIRKLLHMNNFSLTDDDYSLINKYYKGSYNCMIHDPLISPRVLDENNIDALSLACADFYELLNLGD